MINTMALGEAIRRHRKFIGLTQKDAAGLCGVGERYLSELERGKESASIGKALQVIKRLGLRLMLIEQQQMSKHGNDYT